MANHWFRSPEDGRLRAGWRIFLFFVLFVGLSVAFQLSTRAMLGSLQAGSTLVLGLIAIAATIAVYVARRFLDRKSFVSLGLGNAQVAWKDLAFGFTLSGAMAAVVFLIMWALGFVTDVRLSWGDGGMTAALLIAALVPTIFIGYWEELVTRGYLFQNMRDGMGPTIAIVVSCLLYGFMHAANPNAGILSTVIIMLFGFLRLYGYLATGLLWLSMGMHIGWNFFQGPIFGYAASGQASAAVLLSHAPAGPAWLNGGKFGPEASVLIVPVILTALPIMRAWSKRRDFKTVGWLPPEEPGRA
jgi:membrane protease YdiL (CAAX protease family)